MLSAKAAPYTGPFSSDATKLPHSAPTIQALKRMMVREGRMTAPAGGMLNLTNEWPAGGKFDQAYRKWQRDNDLAGDGVYGEQAWKFARAEKLPDGSHALDDYAAALIRGEWEDQNVPSEEDFRAAVTLFCLRAEANEDNWHYRLARPLDVSVEPTAGYVVSDCSMFVIQSYHWASKESGLVVPDPSKQGWSGYGNTDFFEDDHPRVAAPFKVGDLAHYAGHVTICRKAGDARTAVFTSHGMEAGPIPTSLNYRSDLRFVVRPPLS